MEYMNITRYPRGVDRRKETTDPVIVAVLVRDQESSHWRTSREYNTVVPGVGRINVPRQLWSRRSQEARAMVESWISGWLRGREKMCEELQEIYPSIVQKVLEGSMENPV